VVGGCTLIVYAQLLPSESHVPTKYTLSSRVNPVPRDLLRLAQGCYSMTSAYLTELRGRLSAARNKLDDELENVPVDFTKTAIYERQIEYLLQEVKMYSTSEGELVLSCCSSPSKLNWLI